MADDGNSTGNEGARQATGASHAPCQPDLGYVIAMALSVQSVADIYADPLRHGVNAVETLHRLLVSAGYPSRVTDPLVEWVIENTPKDQLDATAARFGITLAEIA